MVLLANISDLHVVRSIIISLSVWVLPELLPLPMPSFPTLFSCLLPSKLLGIDWSLNVLQR